jgi:hypothetical protein
MNRNMFGGFYQNGKVTNDIKKHEIITKYNESFNISMTSRHCKVSRSTVRKVLCGRAGTLGRPKNSTKFRNLSTLNLISNVIESNPQFTCKELSLFIERVTGLTFSLSNLCKIKKMLNIRRLKVNVIASQRFTKRIRTLRADFKILMKSIEREKIIWVDEVHFTSKDLLCRYGYFRDGHKNIVRKEFKPNLNVTFMVAMNYNQVIAIYYKNNINGGCTSVDYISFLKMINVPEGHYIFQDNATVHNSSIVTNFINWRMVSPCLIPFSLDFSFSSTMLSHIFFAKLCISVFLTSNLG